MTPEQRAYHAANKRKWREWAREFGLCITCMRREPQRSHTVCDHCITARIKARRRKKRRVANAFLHNFYQ